MINMKFQPLFITLILAMASCSGKSKLEPCNVSRFHSRPSCRSNHARPASSRKTQIETQCYTAPFNSHSVLCPRSPQPPSIPSISLAHTSIAFSRSHSFQLNSALSSSRFTLTSIPHLCSHIHHVLPDAGPHLTFIFTVPSS